MFVTPLKIYHLPDSYAKLLGYREIVDDRKGEIITIEGGRCQFVEFSPPISIYEIREYIALLNGEDADRFVLRPIMDMIDSKIGRVDDVEGKNSLDESITIKTLDGSIRYSRGAAMRRFQLFDDYFTEFPNNEEITVPYTNKKVNRAIFLDFKRSGSLSKCLDCMRYFNPKQPDEYFQFESLDDVALKDVMELIDNLREQDIVDVMEASQYNGFLMLPAGGRHMPVLARLIMSKNYKEGLMYFRGYPSFSAMIDNSLLYSSSVDFSTSKERIPQRYAKSVHEVIIQAILHSRDKEEVRRLLTMLDVRDAVFGNVDHDTIAMPYCVQPSKKILENYVRSYDPTWIKVASLFELSIDTVDEIILEIVRPSVDLGGLPSFISEASSFCITHTGDISPTPKKERKEEVISPINLDEIDFDDE